MAAATLIKMPKRFDYSSGVQFNAQITAALDVAGVITLDCEQLEYIDSAGIGLLVMAQKKSQSRQSTLTIVNLKSVPKEILQLANLQKIIEIR